MNFELSIANRQLSPFLYHHLASRMPHDDVPRKYHVLGFHHHAAFGLGAAQADVGLDIAFRPVLHDTCRLPAFQQDLEGFGTGVVVFKCQHSHSPQYSTAFFGQITYFPVSPMKRPLLMAL